MRFHGVIVAIALALLAERTPASTQCFIDVEMGPWTCNCTLNPVENTVCTNSTMKVTSGGNGGVSGSFPGLTVSASNWYAKEVSTGGSSCITAMVPPLHCAWWDYVFMVCVTTTVKEGLFWDTVETEVDVTLLTMNYRCEPVPMVVCAPEERP